MSLGTLTRAPVWTGTSSLGKESFRWGSVQGGHGYTSGLKRTGNRGLNALWTSELHMHHR